MPSAYDPSRMFRRALVGHVRALFNDRSRGERPVVSSDNALYPRNSVIWRVHGDVTTMTIGGISALLLQMLHPAALAGVWDHSSFRGDMLGRLRRTARFIATTTYGDRAEAQAAIAHVRDIHQHVRGTLPDGTCYGASDPRLLAWVHVCEALSFLRAWIAFAEPGMSRADQDRYFEEAGLIAAKLGAAPVPSTRTEAEALVETFRPELRASARTREIAHMVLMPRPPSLAMAPLQLVVMHAALEMLPRWARDMHGITAPPLSGPFVRTAANSVAHLVRWAFAREQAARVPG